MASSLGEAIARSEPARKLDAARERVAADGATAGLLKDLEEHGRRVAELVREKKPIEPEDKRRLADLEEKVRLDPLMGELMAAEADYADIIRRVNAAIYGKLSESRIE
jgi:cell fate (sporulation/competence/biofilm development) regulator YlbF (YheA/YmcA/DUF963 family)